MAFTTQQLIERAEDIRKTECRTGGRGVIVPDYMSGPKYNKWLNDIKIKEAELPDNCPLKKELSNAYFFRNSTKNTFEKMVALLESLRDWEQENTSVSHQEKGCVAPVMKKYDLFLSHANADKLEYVDDLYAILKKLGISIFYDKEELSWGDKWKDKILNGTEQSEFAVIVISENFFDREWTERELSEFLNRQNASGQKIILPLLYNITYTDLQNKYPAVADIQAIQSKDKTQEEICILFAKELIKRLKGIQ